LVRETPGKRRLSGSGRARQQDQAMQRRRFKSELLAHRKRKQRLRQQAFVHAFAELDRSPRRGEIVVRQRTPPRYPLGVAHFETCRRPLKESPFIFLARSPFGLAPWPLDAAV